MAADISAAIPQSLSNLSSVECATILLLSNSFLAAVANQISSALLANPGEVSNAEYEQAINEVYPAMEQLSLLIKHPDTARKRHVECHRLAMCMVFCSLATVRHPEISASVRRSWRILWQARASAPKAIGWIRDYEEAAKVEALPRSNNGHSPSDEDILEFVTVPVFLRKKKAEHDE